MTTWGHDIHSSPRSFIWPVFDSIKVPWVPAPHSAWGTGHYLDLQGISFCGEDRDLQLSYRVTCALVMRTPGREWETHEVGEDLYPSDTGSWMEVGEGSAFGTSPACWDLAWLLLSCLQMMGSFKSQLPHSKWRGQCLLEGCCEASMGDFKKTA